MFRASSEEMLSRIFKRTLLKSEESNNSRFILIQLMEKRNIGRHIQSIVLEVHLVYVVHLYLNPIMLVLIFLLLRI